MFVYVFLCCFDDEHVCLSLYKISVLVFFDGAGKVIR